MVDDILEAAARVLVQEGFDAMNTNRVAEVAGVSVGSLYQYFPHKSALIAELIDRRADDERAFMQAWIAQLPAGSLEDVLEATVRGALAFRAQAPELHGALIEQLPHIGRFAPLRRRVEEAAAGLYPLLDAHRERLPDQDVGRAAFVLVNAIHSLTHDGILPRPEGLGDEELVAAAMALVRGYLLPVAVEAGG